MLYCGQLFFLQQAAFPWSSQFKALSLKQKTRFAQPTGLNQDLNQKSWSMLYAALPSFDLEWTLSQISRSRYYSMSNNSQTVQDRAIVTMADQQNPVPWQNWMAAYLGYTLRMKTLFRGWPVMVHDTRTRRRKTESRTWSIELQHFKWPWTTLNPDFKVRPFYDAEYLQNG